MGIPAGLLIDSRGPRIGVLVGAACLAAGYFPIYKGLEAYSWFRKSNDADTLSSLQRRTRQLQFVIIVFLLLLDRHR